MGVQNLIKKISVMFVMLILMSSVFSVAFVQAGAINKGWNFVITGYAVDENGVELVGTDVYSEAAGTTPDSPFYFVDTFFDRYQTPEELVVEKLGEMGQMIHEGYYSDAGVAAQYYSEYVVPLQTDVSSGESSEEFLQDESIVYQHDAYVGALKSELIDAVESGAVSSDAAATTGIDSVQEHTFEMKGQVIDVRQEIVDQIADSEGISSVEADLVLHYSEVDSGVGGQQEKDLAEGLPVAGEAYVEIKEELEVLLESGDVSEEDKVIIENLLHEGEIALEEAAAAYENGFIGDAQESQADAEQILLLAGDIASDWSNYENYINDVQNLVDEVEQEREDEVEKEFEDFSLNKDAMKEKYPDMADQIEEEYDQMERVKELTETMRDGVSTLYEDLIADGLTEQEASAELGRRFDEEFVRVYGEPFHPPGIYENEIQDQEEIEVIPIEDIDFGRQSENADQLSEDMREELSTFYDELVAGGMSEQDASMEVGKAWDQRYEEVYGEVYHPPTEEMYSEEQYNSEGVDDGSVYQPIYDEEGNYLGAWTGDGFKAVEVEEEERGGFVKDHEYVDPVTGYAYTYTDEGYSYKTYLGQEYTVQYDDDFVPEEDFHGFEDGTEVYAYDVDIDGETVKYEYTATGYTATDVEGEVIDSEAYPEGKYETVNGDEDIEIDAFGFEIDPKEGDSVIYEYSPEFENYVSTEGKVYVPAGGASLHVKEIDYEDGIYEYSSGGKVWAYDPNVAVWTSSNGEVYTPYVTSVAPAGYENQGRYESGSGKVWNYDNGQWRSDVGDKWEYSQSEETWKNPDTGVSYNPSLSYQSYQQGYYDSTAREGDRSASYTTYEGVTWDWDEDSGSWNSNSGQTYYVPTGVGGNFGYQSSAQTGGDTSGHSYNYYGYSTDYSQGSSSGQSAGAWSYNSDTGSWESSSGETYYTPVSSSYYSPDYTSSGSSGSESSGGWTYDSSSGNWKSSSGDTYTGGYTYSSGSFSSSGCTGSGCGEGSSSYDSSSSPTYYSASYYAPGYSSADSSSGSSSSGSYSDSSYSGGSYSSGDSSSSSGGGSSSSGGDSGSYSAPSGYFFLNLYRKF